MSTAFNAMLAAQRDIEIVERNSSEPDLAEGHMSLVSVDQREVFSADLSTLVRDLLIGLGEDPGREGLTRTPQRVAKSLREMTSGYDVDIERLINNALFEVPYSEMVIVKDIQFYSLCEHHLLPFFGTCHVAYLPDGKVLGLSKIPRLVNAFSRRLQVQERLTSQIADTLLTAIKPLGVAVVMDARHLCMEMRGAQSRNSPTVTSAMVGAFRTDSRTREEFLGMIKGSRSY